MIFKILLSRSVQTPNGDKKWQTSCPLQTFVCNISRHLEFIIEQGHRINWVSGSLDSRVTGSQNVIQFHVWLRHRRRHRRRLSSRRCRRLSVTYLLFSSFTPLNSNHALTAHRRRLEAVVKVRGAMGGSAPLLRLWRSLAPLLESEPSLPTAGPKLLKSTKNHNVRCRINKF